MEQAQIRTKVKEIVAGVAGIDPGKVGDQATLSGDLGLDSLSRLEIGVDVDYAFKLGLRDESYKAVDSIDAMVELVAERLAQRAADGVAGAA